MKVSHHTGYVVALPAPHPFPMNKYGYLPEILLARGVIVDADIEPPELLPLEAAARVHTPEYLDKLLRGALDDREQRRIGIPWSDMLWRRSRLAAQGTLDAARRALRSGLSANLAGGTHHAFADHGEGFCVLNDVAIAIRVLQAEGVARRPLVVDLDVHQGNGTAAIFADDPNVFTLSLHGESNYPLAKQRSTVDVGLPDGTDDAAYLAALQAHLPAAIAQHAPDLVFYLGGVDVAAGDRYGRMKLSEDGIRARERFVLDQVRGADVPLVLTLAGGYAPTPHRTAELHAILFEEATALDRRRPAQ